MGALNGTIGYLRFRVEGDEDSPAKVLRAVEARRFMELRPTSETSESAGWVSTFDPHDSEAVIDRSSLWQNERLVITYREDRYVIQKALLRRETNKRVERILALEGKDKDSITRAFVKAVEQATLVELKSMTLPRTKLVECIWSPRRKELRIFGRGLMITERITSLFERTFGVRVEMATPAVRALAIIGDDDEENNFAMMAKLQPSLSFQDRR